MIKPSILALGQLGMFCLFMAFVFIGAEQSQKAKDLRNQENVVIIYGR